MKSVFTKRNLVIGAVSAILLMLLISVEISKTNDRKLSEAAITASAEMNGLQDVTVTLQKNSEYGWYEANINCSNFGEFTPREMLAIYKAISAPKAGNTFVFLGKVFSGEDQYSIYPSSNSVYKNRKQIYEGPKPSKASKNSGSLKQRNTTRAMTEQEANALRGSGYHGTRPKSSAEETELAAAMNKCRKCGMHTTNGKNSLCDACLYNKNHGLD